MMNRFYSTDTRRFTSQDVVFGSISGSLSINQFIYTMNNPINFFDPWGRDRWFIDDGNTEIHVSGVKEDDLSFEERMLSDNTYQTSFLNSMINRSVNTTTCLDKSSYQERLIEDYSVFGALVFISEEIFYDSVVYGDDTFRILNKISSGATTFAQYGRNLAPFLSMSIDGYAIYKEKDLFKANLRLSNMLYASLGGLGVGPAAKNIFILIQYDNLEPNEKNFMEWAISAPGLEDSVILSPETWEEIMDEINNKLE